MRSNGDTKRDGCCQSHKFDTEAIRVLPAIHWWLCQGKTKATMNMEDVVVGRATFEPDQHSLEIDLVQDGLTVRKLLDKANILRLASIGSDIAPDLWRKNEQANMRMRLVYRYCMYGHAGPSRVGQYNRAHRLYAIAGRGQRFLSCVTGNKSKRIRRRVRDVESHPGDVRMLYRDDGVTETRSLGSFPLV